MNINFLNIANKLSLMVPSPSHNTLVHNSLYLVSEESVKRGLAGTAILVMQNLHKMFPPFHLLKRRRMDIEVERRHIIVS